MRVRLHVGMRVCVEDVCVFTCACVVLRHVRVVSDYLQVKCAKCVRVSVFACECSFVFWHNGHAAGVAQPGEFEAKSCFQLCEFLPALFLEIIQVRISRTHIHHCSHSNILTHTTHEHTYFYAHTHHMYLDTQTNAC